MRFSRWMDHLPPWLAFGAVLGTGFYSPLEMLLMALPLGAALLVEARRWDLGRWRHALEIAAALGFLAQVFARTGVLSTGVTTLFLLCGVRLALPRETAQRRQVLLMGFLIFLTTAITTTELTFLVWAIVWLLGAALTLMQQNWDAAAKGGPRQLPPYGRALHWAAATLVLAGAFFVILPRVTLGLHPQRWGSALRGSSAAGLSDRVELDEPGPIQGNGEVVMRILPAGGQTTAGLELLRGVVLEVYEGGRWEPHAQAVAPKQGIIRFELAQASLECFLEPSRSGILPLPYGTTRIQAPPLFPVFSGPGDSLRFPAGARSVSLRLEWHPNFVAHQLAEGPLPPARQAILLHTGPGTEAALRWGLAEAPGEMPPQALAERLSKALHRFRYTLDNPSGGADDPLEDFLERSHAGHCEYFASALALALRHRGVPARVVNGYRLGPWIPEGGYFLVTQNEAHSWVEYYDPGVQGWRIADPTPPAPPEALAARNWQAAFQRWIDATRFRWDRHVVRFSDEDQLAGLEWLRGRFDRLSLRPLVWGAVVLAALLMTWRSWLARKKFSALRTAHPKGLRALRPLLCATRKDAPPRPGETAKTWLLRLAALNPARRPSLEALSREIDARVYGLGSAAGLAGRVREEARAWKQSTRLR